MALAGCYVPVLVSLQQSWNRYRAKQCIDTCARHSCNNHWASSHLGAGLMWLPMSKISRKFFFALLVATTTAKVSLGDCFALPRYISAGDATLSMSCSDKLAKWNLLGVQGSLLSSVMTHPLLMSSATAGHWEAQDSLDAATDAFQRAITGDCRQTRYLLKGPF